MYPVALSTLMRRTLQRANLEGANAGSSPFISDPELIDNINTSIAPWWDLIIGSSFAGQIARSAYSIPGGTTGGQSLYPLPANFARMISVDCLVSNQVSVTGQPYNEEQRNQFKWLMLSGWTVNYPILYQLQGSNINFLPTPQGSFAVTLNYIPVAPILSDPNDTLDSIQGWEEWIVLDAAAKLGMKDGDVELIQVLESRREQETLRIKAAAPNRDMGAPERIHVTRGLDWGEGEGGDLG